jgi:hypothetical protein
LIVLCICLSGCGSSSSGSATTPVPPAPAFYTIDIPDELATITQGTLPTDINGSGEVVGFGPSPTGAWVGFTYSSSGVLTPFAAPNATDTKLFGTVCWAINSPGTAAGSFTAGIFPTTSTLGYTRAGDGSFQVIQEPGSTFVAPEVINDQGDIAGIFSDANSASHGFILTTNGTFSSFDIPGAATDSVNAIRITASDTVVGNFVDANSIWHGYIRTADGTVSVVDAPGASTQTGTGTTIDDMNTEGTIVGSVYPHSFLRAADGMFVIFDPPDTGKSSSANGINTAGAISGTFSDVNGLLHGYIRDPDGAFTVIDNPNASSVAGSGTTVSRINDAGQIIGTYTDAQGVNHGFVRK